MDKTIPEALYEQIHALMPIVCVDVAIVGGRGILLVKRANKPAQGEWWLPGGRVWRDERLEDAAKRKVDEEIGVRPESVERIGFEETMFPDGPFGGTTHTVNALFRAEIPDDSAIALDGQGTEWAWFAAIDEAWDPYVKKYAALALGAR